MMISLLTLVWLSAAPVSTPPSEDAARASSSEEASFVAVAVTAGPGLARVATEAGEALALQLAAPFIDWSGYLRVRGGPACAREPRCLFAAPGVSDTSRLVFVSVRPLAGGRLAVDLRLIAVERRAVLGRSAAVCEPDELAGWLERTATRLLTQASPYAKVPPRSPYALPIRPAP